MSRATLAVGLAALVLLAGCGSAVAPGVGTPTRTVTPAPLPVEPSTPSGPAVLVPGLSAEGVFDAGDLADAHVAALTGTSFTAVREEQRRYANGSLRSSYRSVVRMSADGSRFRYALNQTNVRDGRPRTQHLARYANGSVVYVAVTRDGVTAYSVLGGLERPVEPSDALPDGATARSGLSRLFRSLRFDVVGQRVVDGRTVYHVAVENGSQTLGRLRNVTMNATVREDGLVAAYRLAYNVGDVRVTIAVRFQRLGETEVPPPAWLPAARTATGTATPVPMSPSTPADDTTGPTSGTHTQPSGSATAATVVGVSPLRPRVPGGSAAVSSRSWSGGVRP